MNSATEQNVELPGGFAPNPVLVKGDGAPVVYLHGPFGQEWDGFLDDLATHRRVYAPAHAGSELPVTRHFHARSKRPRTAEACCY